MGIFNISYFCEFCSNLRRAVLLYGAEVINESLINELGLSLMKTPQDKEQEKEQEREKKE